jgi:hypothetical protein
MAEFLAGSTLARSVATQFKELSKMIRRSLISCAVVVLAFAAGVACGKKSEDLSREPLARGQTTVVGAPADAPKPPPAPSTVPVTTAPPAPVAKITTPSAPVKKITAPASAVSVKRIVVTSAIEKREPVLTDTFSTGADPVFAFLELSNTSDHPAIVEVTFEHAEGKTVGHVKLEIPAHSTKWRTWGKTRFIRQAGSWNAVVRGEDGSELAKKAFDVNAS